MISGFFALNPLARLGSAALRLGMVLLVLGAFFGAAIFLKNLGTVETQRDIAVQSNERIGKTLEDVLAEVKDIQEMQAAYKRRLEATDEQVRRVREMLLQLKEEWMHTPIRELLDE